jgi:hypothetical protein
VLHRTRVLETIYEVTDRVIYHSDLPRRLLDSRNIPFQSLLAEADAAEVEITHKTPGTAALEAPQSLISLP